MIERLKKLFKSAYESCDGCKYCDMYSKCYCCKRSYPIDSSKYKSYGDNYSTDDYKIKIKMLSHEIEKPAVTKVGNWVDLRSAEDVELKNGEHAIIKLGIAVELGAGYEAHIVPRSSTFKNFGIIQTNHMGVIDETYCGDNDEWGMPVLAVRDTKINKGDRICQFRVVKAMGELDIDYVETLGNPDRNGFGSTGTK